MKLGTQTGSLINHYLATAEFHTPQIGDGATILYWTDRQAATVIDFHKTRDNKSLFVTVHRDHVRRVDDNGMSDAQEYEYSRDENGVKTTFRLDTTMASPKWVEVRQNQNTGRWNRVKSGIGLSIGRRDEHYDFSF